MLWYNRAGSEAFRLFIADAVMADLGSWLMDENLNGSKKHDDDTYLRARALRAGESLSLGVSDGVRDVSLCL